MKNLNEMTPDELYTLNAPIRAKLDAHQPLTDEEQQLHSAICAEVLRQMDALRASELAERAERMAEYQAQEDVEHPRNGYGASQDDEYDHVRCEECGKVMSLDDANAALEVLPAPHCGHDWDDYKPYFPTCSDIEDPDVQSCMLRLNEQREREDREAAKFYDLMAEAQ